MPLVDVLDSSTLSASQPREVEVDGRCIALVRLGDEIHAIDGHCPQDGAPLVGGELVGAALRCEKRGGRFDVITGQSLRGGEDVRRYHVREEGGRVLVQVDTPLPELEQGRIVAS